MVSGLVGASLPRWTGSTLALTLAVPAFAAACDHPRSAPCRPMAESMPLAERVPVIDNTGPGLWERAGRSPRFRELWRQGGANPGEELAFPLSASASPSGRLAVPDFVLGEVIVIEADGQWRGAWTRRGEGPGEVSTPIAATWNLDGTLVVFDIVGFKIVYLRDGQPADDDVAVDPSFSAPVVDAGQLVWAGVQPGGQVLTFPAWSPLRTSAPAGEAVAVILWLARGAAVPDTVSRSAFPTVSVGPMRSWPVPGWARLAAGVGGGGTLAVGATDETYRILVYDSEGRPARQDVFDGDGVFLGEVRMPPGSALQAAKGDTVWAFRVGELDEVWVVAYALELERSGSSELEDGSSEIGVQR